MQTQSLSCCSSCFPGEVVNKNPALYTECLGIFFHTLLKKGERTLKGGVFVEMGWSWKSSITLHHGANQAMNDCQLLAIRYSVHGPIVISTT